MRVYVDTVRQQKADASTTVEERPRRNAIQVKARPVLACDSQEWLYFKSQTAAKRHCFGKRGLKLNTGITYALKCRVGSVLGWHFAFC